MTERRRPGGAQPAPRPRARVLRRRAAAGGDRHVRLVRSLLLRAVPPARPTTPEWIDAHFRCAGMEHIAGGVADGHGRGARAAAPRQLGLRRRVARALQGYTVTVVAEPVEPPELFDWFVETRARLGMRVIPLVAVGRHRGAQGGARQRGGVPPRRPRPHRRRHRRSSSSASAPRCPAARRCSRSAAARRCSRRVLLPRPRPPARPTSSRRSPAARTGTPPRRPRPGHPGPRSPVRGPHPGGAHALAPAAAQLAQRPRLRPCRRQRSGVG